MRPCPYCLLPLSECVCDDDEQDEAPAPEPEPGDD